MKFNWINTLIGILISIGCHAQVLPTVSCSNLSGQTFSLPSAKEKYSILLVTFSKKGNEAAETWVDPLVQKFIRKSGLLDAFFTADVYALSIVNSAEWAMIRSQEQKIKADIPAELLSNLVYSQTSPQPILDILGEKAKNSATVLLVQSDGKIIRMVSGEYSDKKLEELEEGFE
jgi:hypothetical protein